MGKTTEGVHAEINRYTAQRARPLPVYLLEVALTVAMISHSFFS